MVTILIIALLLVIAVGVLYKYRNSHSLKPIKQFLIENYNIMVFNLKNEAPLTFSKQIAIGLVIIVIVIGLTAWITTVLTI